MTREILTSQIEALEAAVTRTPQAAANRARKIDELRDQLAALDRQRHDETTAQGSCEKGQLARPVHFERLGVLRADMCDLFDSLAARLEEPPARNP